MISSRCASGFKHTAQSAVNTALKAAVHSAATLRKAAPWTKTCVGQEAGRTLRKLAGSAANLAPKLSQVARRLEGHMHHLYHARASPLVRTAACAAARTCHAAYGAVLHAQRAASHMPTSFIGKAVRTTSTASHAIRGCSKAAVSAMLKGSDTFSEGVRERMEGLRLLSVARSMLKGLQEVGRKLEEALSPAAAQRLHSLGRGILVGALL